MRGRALVALGREATLVQEGQVELRVNSPPSSLLEENTVGDAGAVTDAAGALEMLPPALRE